MVEARWSRRCQALALEMNWTGGSRDARAVLLRRFVEMYDGTPAALSAEVELIHETPTLVTGFFVSDSPPPTYAPGNLQRSLDE